MAGAIGVDASREELALAAGERVQASAQALPFRDGSFDACVCHLAFMLFADVERVVAELGRVIVPGGTFAAVLGGGPVAEGAEGAEGEDAFHVFLRIARAHLGGAMPGDRRASREAGWRELFAGWRGAPAFERVVLEMGGAFEDVWAFLGASYQLDPGAADGVRDALRAEVGERCECRVVTWIATVRR